MLADPLSSHVTHLLGACARPFSADREYLHATHQSFTRPPMAIIAQCVVVLFACTWGIVIATPGLKPIRVISGQGDIRNFDFFMARPAFATFDHRAFR